MSRRPNRVLRAVGFGLLTACGSDSKPPSEPARLTVTAVNPNSGPLAGGTAVAITGTNFVDITSVTIGGSALVSLTIVSGTQITGTTAAATDAGAKDIVVNSSSRGTSSCTGCFSYVEVDVPSGNETRIAAGWDHTCALTTDGAAYCWGNNTYGALGDGSRTNSAVPVAVAGGLEFTSLAAGSAYTCGLTSSGTAYCWGLNQSGELGNGSTANSSIPIAVAGGLNFIMLVSSGDHTCALTRAGAAYCWGKNDAGQLGNGMQKPTSQPGSVTPVAVSGGLSFTSVDAGGYHTCGITIAGATYCWGLNDSGELGNGLQGTNATTPVAVSGRPSFSSVTTGFYHSCGLTSVGFAFCWGTNRNGQLGNGSTSGPDYCPTYPNTGACSLTPIAVNGGLHFDLLALGGSHSCGLANGGVAYCWGANGNGELGNGSRTTSSTPIAVSSGFAFEAIAAAITGYTCAITASGAAYCWGKNDVGQLGNGSTSDASTPVAVSGFPPR